MTPWGYLGSGTLLAVAATIAVASGLAAGHDSSDAMWLFLGIGVVLAVVALPLIMIGAVAKGRRVSKTTSR
jgi:bacteriorhodopsin